MVAEIPAIFFIVEPLTSCSCCRGSRGQSVTLYVVQHGGTRGRDGSRHTASRADAGSGGVLAVRLGAPAVRTGGRVSDQICEI